MNKVIFDVFLQDNGELEVTKSDSQMMYNNDIMSRFISGTDCEYKCVGIVKQSYEKDIEATKIYLVDYRIKENNKELKRIQKEMRMYEKVKKSLM